MESCPSCGKLAVSFKNLHGFLSHCGMPHAIDDIPVGPAHEGNVGEAIVAEDADSDNLSEPAAAPEQEAMDEEPDEEPDEHMGQEMGEEMGEEQEAAGSAFASPTDEFIAQMWVKFPNMTKAMLNEVIKATQLGPATLRSADTLFKTIDALPGEVVLMKGVSTLMLNVRGAGLEFLCSSANIGNVEYHFYYRGVKDAVAQLLDRVGSLLEIPSLRNPDVDDIGTFWHGRDYQRHLQQFVDDGASLENDLLLPLVFSSGKT